MPPGAGGSSNFILQPCGTKWKFTEPRTSPRHNIGQDSSPRLTYDRRKQEVEHVKDEVRKLAEF